MDHGAVRQLNVREFQSLGAATEKRRAAMSMLCGERKENCVDVRNERD